MSNEKHLISSSEIVREIKELVINWDNKDWLDTLDYGRVRSDIQNVCIDLILEFMDWQNRYYKGKYCWQSLKTDEEIGSTTDLIKLFLKEKQK